MQAPNEELATFFANEKTDKEGNDWLWNYLRTAKTWEVDIPADLRHLKIFN